MTDFHIDHEVRGVYIEAVFMSPDGSSYASFEHARGGPLGPWASAVNDESFQKLLETGRMYGGWTLPDLEREATERRRKRSWEFNGLFTLLMSEDHARACFKAQEQTKVPVET